MKRIEIEHAETGECVVHYDGPFTEFALCGDAIEVDYAAAAREPTETTRRVTCDRCKLVVAHVRGR